MFDESAYVRYLKRDQHGHIERRDLNPTEVLMVEIARFDDLAEAENEGRLVYVGPAWHRQRFERLSVVLQEQQTPLVRAALLIHRWTRRLVRRINRN